MNAPGRHAKKTAGASSRHAPANEPDKETAMTTDNEPRISVAPPDPAPDRPDDRTLTLTFAPDAPLAMVRVEIDPAIPASAPDRDYLTVLDQALARLQQYRNDYVTAAAADLLLTPPPPRFVGSWRRHIGATQARTTPRACRRHTAF